MAWRMAPRGLRVGSGTLPACGGLTAAEWQSGNQQRTSFEELFRNWYNDDMAGSTARRDDPIKGNT